MLELGHPQLEVLHLRAAHDAQALHDSLDRLVMPAAQPFGLLPPRRDRVPHGRARRVTVDAEPPGKVIRELVERLDARRRCAETGEDHVREAEALT